ncbi:hypothetical protein D046_4665A, partial [Vibrio parahaemolyticus V-223/04]
MGIKSCISNNKQYLIRTGG